MKTTSLVAYVLMLKRTKILYEDMLKNLPNTADIEIKPSALRCDFEAALIKNFEKIYSSTSAMARYKAYS